MNTPNVMESNEIRKQFANHRPAPWWLGYVFLNPLRRLWDSPRKVLAPIVRDGDTVLELGPAMGWFTLDLARMVGPRGRVVAAEVQRKMLDVLERRAARAGLSRIVEPRLTLPDDPCVNDLQESVDFVLLYHVIHEVDNAPRVLGRIAASVRPGGKVLLSEPQGHVSKELFAHEIRLAREAGLEVVERPRIFKSRSVLLAKPRD